MSFTKVASFEDTEVLEVKGSPTRQHTASLDRLSDFHDYRTDDGYMYVRLRAISSRVNKNNDGWPSVELAGGPEVFERFAKQSSSGFTVEASEGDKRFGFATFMGKPNFIDHNNSDPSRARGVVVDAKLRVLPQSRYAGTDDYWDSPSLDPEHAPPTEIELLLEIDAKQFPKYAKAVRSGDLDGFSMGCDVRESKCSHCGHVATNPDEYCSHILMKGAHHDYKTADGKRISRKSYENCLTPETPIRMANGHFLQIADVAVGRMIIDHLGEEREVLNIHARQIDEDILEIHRSGQGTDRPLRVTTNHPLLVVKGKKKNLQSNDFQPEFIEAGCLQEGDWVVETHPRHKGLLKQVLTSRTDYHAKREIPDVIDLTEDFGRWCGWYLAEGSISYNRLASGERSEASTIFSLHRNERREQNEILNLGKRLFGLDGKVETRNNGSSILFHNRQLAVFMSQLGTSSQTKALPHEWLDGPIQFINGVVGAHGAGDGHQDDLGGYRPNEILHSTSSPTLADQLYDMNIWLGHTPSRRLDKPSNLNKRTVAGNVIVYPEKRQRSARGRIETDQWRLAKITRIDHVRYTGPVYNLEVADTHTYIANGQAVHNCYGIHFFEISGVFDPADETALAREVRASINDEGLFVKKAHGEWPNEAGEWPWDVKHEPEVDPVTGQETVHLPPHYPNMLEYLERLDPTPEVQKSIEEHRNYLDHIGYPRPMKDPSDPRVVGASVHTAENPLPQSFETTAPEEVDTMRQEHNCPICGETMDGETCDVCFLPGTLIRTKAGYIPIEKIIPGDEVLGESGEFNPVMDTIVREWHGHVKRIDGPSLVEPIYTTNNHPFKVLVSNHETKTERCQPARCERHSKFEDIHHLDWAHAGCLSSNSYVATGVPLNEEDKARIEIPLRFTEKHKNGAIRNGPDHLDLTSEMLWAIGLYIAEGFSGDRVISYSSHRDEFEYQDRICDLFESLGYTARIVYKEDSAGAWTNISSSVLAEWFPEWLGKGCENKRIPAELMNLPLEKLQHVYRGILDGDGCDQGNDLKQTSKILALQVNEIARRMGISATIQRAQESGKKESFTVNNVTNKKRGYNVSVSGKTTKAPRNTWDIEGQKLYRLKSAEDVEYYGPVYNLKVANDPTYTVQNLTVHNCGYVEPPKGMDNPDLTKAKELQGDTEQASQQNVQEDDSMVQHQGEPQGQPMPPPGGPQSHPKQPGSFLQTRNRGASASVMGDMRWQPKLNPKVAARIKQFEKPLLPGTTPASNDPQEAVVTKNPQKPVTAAMRTAQDLIEAAKHNQTGDTMSTTHIADGPTGPEASPDARVDVTGTGGVIEPSNEAASTADAQVDVLGVGSTGVTDVEAESTESLPTASESSDDSGFDATKTTDDSGPTKTFGDSDGSHKGVSDPVTGDSLEGNQNKGSSVRRAYDSKPFYDQPGLSGGSANKGTEPVDPVGKAQDRVDVLQATTTPDNNSGPTSQWTGTEGNKVERQQDPVTTEVSDMQFDGFTSHFVAGLKLADMEIDLGLIERDAKYDRLAELSAQTDEEIGAQMDMLSRVKTAGTKKLAQARTAGVARMPGAFGRATASAKRFAGDDESVDAPVDEDVADAALFSR